MRKKRIHIIILFIIILLMPAWMYTSGNVPSLFPSDRRLIRLVQDFSPTITEITYKGSHRAYIILRDYGIEILYSYNERYLLILGIRTEVARICDSILQDIYQDGSK